MILDLKPFKEEKKYKKIISDIDSILLIFGLTQKSLSFFKEYVVCQEIISIIETNKVLLELHKKDYSTRLKEITND